MSTDGLFIGESRLLHVRHSPEVDGLCAIQLVRPRGGMSQGLTSFFDDVVKFDILSP